MKKYKFVLAFFSSVFVLLLLCMVTPLFATAVQEVVADSNTAYLEDALTQESIPNVTNENLQLPDIFDTIIRFLFSLLIIVGLIWGAAFLYKKVNGVQYFLNSEGELIKVLERRYIDQKSNLQIVDIAGKIFLIGSGADGIQHVSEIKDEDTIKRIYSMAEMRSAQYRTPDFKKMLAGFSEKKSSDIVSSSENKPISGFNKLQSNIEKIKKMLYEKK